MALSPVEVGLISGLGAAIGSAGMIALVFKRAFKEIEETQNCLGSLKKAVSDLNILIANKYQRTSFCGDRREECKQDMKDFKEQIRADMAEVKADTKDSFDEVFNRLRNLEERTTRLETERPANGRS